MLHEFRPEIDKVYFINKYTLFLLISGTGSIQVDFANYNEWKDKAIFLGKGQYIKFLSDDFLVRKLEFPTQEIYGNKDVRVLFKHLISLGYINFNVDFNVQNSLTKTLFQGSSKEIIDVSLQQWFCQNPFNASKSEYQVIFDVKEIIDKEYMNQLAKKDLEALINENGSDFPILVKNKLGITVKMMLDRKRLVESKKEVVFTDKNIQEVCYDMGFKDPAYFNRIFKKSTGYSPTQFRNNFDYDRKDTFIEDILGLVREFHTTERSLMFYADKMNMSIKTLSKKTKDKTNRSLGQIIRNELVNSSKSLLFNEVSIKEISFHLGFEEPNHFSTFFKHHTGLAPSEFKHQKVQENVLFL